MKCRCPGRGHIIEGDDYKRTGRCCIVGTVTSGCNCTQCSTLRDARMTHKQRVRASRRKPMTAAEWLELDKAVAEACTKARALRAGNAK